MLERRPLVPTRFRRPGPESLHCFAARLLAAASTVISSSAGRISKLPAHTPGCLDINRIAWFRSLALGTKFPPSCSLGFCKGAIGDGHFAVLEPQGGGLLGALKRLPANEMTLLAEYIVIGETTHPSRRSALYRTWHPTFSHRSIQGICISSFSPSDNKSLVSRRRSPKSTRSPAHDARRAIETVERSNPKADPESPRRVGSRRCPARWPAGCLNG